MRISFREFVNMAEVRTSDLLSFQEYSPIHDSHSRNGSAKIEVEAVHTAGYNPSNQKQVADEMQRSRFSESSAGDSPMALGDDSDTTPEKNHSFWTIEYYQKYFDVTTDDVIERIISSILPQRASPNYFDQTIKSKPDLYGPIWITITLIFTIGISGNISNYLQHANQNFVWRYDFHLVSYAATAIFCYVWLLPLALWGVLKWSSQEDTLSLESDDKPTTPSMISLLCLYGYSLSIYVPISILWTIQVSWLQWLLVLMGAFLSGAVLIYWLLPALKRSKHTVPLIGCILAFHFLLAAGFMLYFFHVPNSQALQVSTPKPIIDAIKNT